MPDAVLSVLFALAAIVSLLTSWLLVSQLERLGARLGLSEGLLGMTAALAADAPEITAAVSALANHRAHIGAGVALGSNVFNLAALLGLASVISGRIVLHRRVIALEGVVAVTVAATALCAVMELLSPAVGLAIALGLLLPYVALLGMPGSWWARLPLPQQWVGWLRSAVVEEEAELEVAIHPRPSGTRASGLASLATLVVVAASIAMERAASTLGSRHGLPDIITGGLLLAGVTSVPNAVAAVYLARRQRGTATLSTALNSNALNAVFGLLLPASLLRLGPPSASTTIAAAWYVGLTALSLGGAYAVCGLRRRFGALIICAYVAFAGAVAATA